MSEEKPLITIGIMCYNLEKVIAEALESAFAQTYSPLEIVVSDNASTDKSWEVIERMVSDYQSRPMEPGRPRHKIIINRNDHNLNIIGNLQKIVDISHGEFIVKLDGDDIAHPKRIEIIVDDWNKNNREALLIAHSYVDFDINGERGGFRYVTGWDTWEKRRENGRFKDIPRELSNGVTKKCHIGAIAAYHRRLFNEFPRFSIPGAVDDAVLQMRALMIGKIRTLADCLIKHRLNGVSTNQNVPYRYIGCRNMHFGRDADKQILIDLEAKRNDIPAQIYQEMRKWANEDIFVFDSLIQLVEGDSFLMRYDAYKKYCSSGVSQKNRLRAWIKMMFPNIFGDYLLKKI